MILAILVQVAPLSSEYSHLTIVPLASEPKIKVPLLAPLQTVALADNVPPTDVGSIWIVLLSLRIEKQPVVVLSILVNLRVIVYNIWYELELRHN